MATDIGARVGLDGAAQFRSDLRLITQQSKELAAEMKAVAASFTTAGSSQQKLAATAETLQKQIGNQKQRIDLLNKSYDAGRAKLKQLAAAIKQATEQYGEESQQVSKVVNAYNTQAIAVSKTKTQINQATAALGTMENQLADVTAEMKGADGAADTLQDALDDTGDALDDAGKKAASFGDVLRANLITDVIVSSVKKLADVVRNNLDAAFSRVDTIKSYRLVMTGLGYTAEDAEAAINALTDGIQGLPTALPDIVSVQQQFAALSGDIGEATKLTIALNNATLAGGQGQEKANSALEQWYQVIANGKPDLQSWRIILQAMPAQLKQIAQEIMGAEANSNDLFAAWQDGTVTTEEVTAAIVKLSDEGANGFDSFAQQAQAASGGIQTSLTNIQTAIVSKLASAVQEIEGEGGRISGTLAQIKAAIQGIDVQPIAIAIGTMFDFLTQNGPLVVSVITGIGAAFTAWNVASMITGVVSAIKAMEGATIAAKVAQLALNSAFAANPIGLVITAVTGLVAAIVTLWNTNQDFRNFFIGAWNAIKTTVQDFLTTANGVFDNFRHSAINAARDAGQGIIDGVGTAVNWLKGLASQAWQWGSDMIGSMARGIMDGVGEIGKAVGSIVSAITSKLHFSRPDEGPLRDYETWMPDMIAGMAKGIRANAYQLENAAEYLAARLVVPQITAPAVSAAGAQPQNSPAGGAAPSISITVYGAQGQDVNQLAEIIMQKMESAVNRKAGVWA